MSTSIHLVCPHCESVNRVPQERLDAQPGCGKCHQRLLDANPRDVSAESLRKYLARNDLPVAVDFWASWCGPCQAMAPEFAKAAAQLEGSARLLKLNTEAEPALAAQYGIRSIPTVLLFMDGREVARRSGAMRSPDVVRWVREQQNAARPA